jgi:hypothetical protein
MASQILAVQFIGPVPSGATVTMSWSGAGGTVTSATEEFVPLRNANYKTTISSNLVQQAINFKNALLTDYAANLNVTQAANIVFISSKNTTNPMSGATTSSNIIFDGNANLNYFNVREINARSPYLLISSSISAFTESQFTITQYEGDILDYVNNPVSYIKTKQKITPTQENVWINLSNLLKEDLESDIGEYINYAPTLARELRPNESKWAFIETVNSYLTTPVTTAYTFCYLVDGYIDPTEQQEIPRILMTGEKRYLHRNCNARIYFKTRDLTTIKYSSATSGQISVEFTGNTTDNTGYIKSITVDNIGLINDNDSYITYEFNYGGTKSYQTFYFYPECKYEVYNLVFKNKHGMLETLSMSKKTSKSLSVEGDEFLRSIVDLEGNFNIDRHTRKQFNVTGTEEWTLNTEFLPEYMNAPIKEAMLSEEMWLVDSNENIIPVIRMDQSIDFKTSLNDKMIQYTINVKLSHNTVNNIQ